MNTRVFDCVLLLPLLLMINWFPSLHCSTSCSIFVSLNCSCFQSNTPDTELLVSLTYSHLYCQGETLSKEPLQWALGVDRSEYNRFRTISIELTIEDHLEVSTNQFDGLAFLFSATELDIQVEISLRFTRFTRLTFEKESLTSRMFHTDHRNRRLSLTFVPLTRILLEVSSC